MIQSRRYISSFTNTLTQLRDNQLDSLSVSLAMQSQDFTLLCTMLKNATRLTTITIALGNPISDENLAKLLDAMKATGISTLNMHGGSLCNRQISLLEQHMKDENFPIINLNLNMNLFADEGAKKLAKLIASNARIKSLDISFSQIQKSGAELIGNALPFNRYLQTLNLAGNTIGIKGFTAIILGATAHPTLNTLNLSFNFNYTATTLQEAKPKIRRLSEKIKNLLILTPVVDLKLQNCCFDEYCAEQLALGLAQNKTLRKLNVAGNFFHNQDIINIIDSIINNEHLLVCLETLVLNNTLINQDIHNYIKSLLVKSLLTNEEYTQDHSLYDLENDDETNEVALTHAMASLKEIGSYPSHIAEDLFKQLDNNRKIKQFVDRGNLYSFAFYQELKQHFFLKDFTPLMPNSLLLLTLGRILLELKQGRLDLKNIVNSLPQELSELVVKAHNNIPMGLKFKFFGSYERSPESNNTDLTTIHLSKKSI